MWPSSFFFLPRFRKRLVVTSTQGILRSKRNLSRAQRLKAKDRLIVMTANATGTDVLSGQPTTTTTFVYAASRLVPNLEFTYTLV